MKNYPITAHILLFAKRLLMTIGLLLFVLLGGITIAKAGSPSAAKHSADPQPELQAVAPFSR